MSLNNVRSLLAAMPAILALAPANASIITSVNTGPGGGGLTVTAGSVSTPNPGNYPNSLSTPNFLSYSETWTSAAVGSANFSNIQGAPTEYRTTLNITNNTGLTMTGYTIYVGSGTIAQPSFLNWFLLHDHNIFPTTSSAGGTFTMPGATNSLGNFIVWSGLNVAQGSSFSLNFNLVLPLTGNFGQWSITQQPTLVPSPAPLALTSLALLLNAPRRRRN